MGCASGMTCAKKKSSPGSDAAYDKKTVCWPKFSSFGGVSGFFMIEARVIGADFGVETNGASGICWTVNGLIGDFGASTD